MTPGRLPSSPSIRARQWTLKIAMSHDGARHNIYANRFE
jgi:hypothetical protein